MQGERRDRAEAEREAEKKRQLQKEEELQRSREFNADRVQEEMRKPRGDAYDDIVLLNIQPKASGTIWSGSGCFQWARKTSPSVPRGQFPPHGW